MVGRDIGSIVMPDADFKIFLEAPLAERARRRHDDLARRSTHLSLDTVEEDLRRRDALDQRNTLIPEDAVVLRNEGMSPEDEVAHILRSFEQERALGVSAEAGTPSSPAAP
jgi:cytidylate kinase